MKKTGRTILIAAAAAVLAWGTLSAQDDELMDRAVKKYLRGDYVGATEDFTRILELEPSNTKARQLLYKSVFEEGSRRFNNSEFAEARKYLLIAEEMDPTDTRVIELLKETDRKLGLSQKKIEAAESSVKDLQVKIERERSSRNEYRKQITSLESERDELRKEIDENRKLMDESRRKIEEYEGIIIKKQKTLFVTALSVVLLFFALVVFLILSLRRLSSSASESQYQLEDLQNSISEKLKKSDEESAALEERVARSINQMVDGQKDVVKQMSLSAAGKTRNDIQEIKDKLEQKLDEQQERLLDLLAQQAKALSTETTEKIELKGKDGRTIITDVNPHVRARADSVEMIPKTITDPVVAQKMIKPYLVDPNNRVRGNACVAMHQYNPEASIDTLNKMAASTDKWMRLSAAWAAGIIATPEVVQALRKLIDDVEERVRDRAVMAFENIADIKTELAQDMRKMINQHKRMKEDRGGTV
ncbi:MAG: HEAT repeat domain-containing protein [Elusimicrobia bacterium]|nr:HEAT repeat domain-containing protein [Elusimicrobiota bacterium]